ncbi:hypothetical protein EMCRGX_G007820 [Ephydatia muelleri]
MSFGFSIQNEPNHSTLQAGTLETAAAEHQCLVNNAHDSVNETEPSATMLAPSNDWQPSDPCSSSQSSRPMDEYVPISMLQAPLDVCISVHSCDTSCSSSQSSQSYTLDTTATTAAINDPAKWTVTDNLREYWALHGPTRCYNNDGSDSCSAYWCIGSWLATMGPSRYTTWMASSSHHGKDTLASEKLKGPTTTIIFLGILLHASVQQLCLPPDKLEELTGLTRSWYFQAQGHQEGTALAHQQAPLCFKGGANREVLPLLPDQPVHQCQEAPPPHQQALTLRQELMLCEFHCEPCGQSFQYQSQYKKHVASRLHITFVEELSGFMQPVENEEAAIHDEQPLQMHSEDVFHAKQQPTADIDDSPDDVEDVVDDDDDDPDIVEWEMYHGDAWRNDSRFFSPMATSKDILAHIEILLDLFQFQHMVPDTTVTHLSSDSLISYGIMNAPVSDIVGLATPPVRTSAIRFWFCMDGQAARADGKRVMMLPLILFSDDTSGNQSKKWHKFESWYLSFAGLPLHLNARIENINFVCSSNSVSPLDLSEPIAQQLTALETEGVFNTFDASHHETVQVVAPLMCIVYDNPRASVLLNHLGSAALKHCPRCMTTRQENPDTVCALWTKDMALQQIAQMLTEADRVGMRKSFGLREDYNPLLCIPADLYPLLTAAYSVVFDMEQRERERKRSAKLCKSLDSFFPSKNVAIPFLDHILFNLYSRFSPLSTTATSLLTLVPAIICARNGELGNTYHDA